MGLYTKSSQCYCPYIHLNVLKNLPSVVSGSKQKQQQRNINTKKRYTRKVRPGTQRPLKRGPRDPGPRTQNTKMSSWDLGHRVGDPKIFKWDSALWPPKWNPGSGIPKYLSETRDFRFSLVLIVYSTLNTLHFTYHKTLE